MKSLLAGLALLCSLHASEGKVDILSLDVLSYEQLMANDPETVDTLSKALHTKGIVGIRGVPGFIEASEALLATSREFSALPEEVKEEYAPKAKDLFLGYERGKEKFQRPDGKWFIDDLKVSYYAWIPNQRENRWPLELDLETPFERLGSIMAKMGEEVLARVYLGNIPVSHIPKLGRMLYYQKKGDTGADNPYWCGAHYDHGLLTVLAPSCYFLSGKRIPEPLEAGLFVRIEGKFYKVEADPEVMMFQVGEFGQLATNDGIRATEHRVHKPFDSDIERYTIAVFFNAPMETVIYSSSELTKDARYGGSSGDPCSYERWNEESFKRYIAR